MVQSNATGPASPSNTSPDIQTPPTRNLNAPDALTYLNAVKAQIEPEVYQLFLTTMQDYRRQVIDTRGVIERVAQLFHRYSLLKHGFKRFLPPRLRIHMARRRLRRSRILRREERPRKLPAARLRPWVALHGLIRYDTRPSQVAF
ncbi:hypothetical protein GGX14DRAFT_557836 [Mycena pura]|uniref:Uncharacterized protein n=1 Tax=Mycena pura TaxID=153505 RepID=A0AAD6YLS6_9AGAR|nr:hypothetical protein GGX14DRAFT_557836 [Mycena pura]